MTIVELSRLEKNDQIEWFERNNQSELYDFLMKTIDPAYKSIIEQMKLANDAEYQKLFDQLIQFYKLPQ